MANDDEEDSSDGKKATPRSVQPGKTKVKTLDITKVANDDDSQHEDDSPGGKVTSPRTVQPSKTNVQPKMVKEEIERDATTTVTDFAKEHNNFWTRTYSTIYSTNTEYGYDWPQSQEEAFLIHVGIRALVEAHKDLTKQTMPEAEDWEFEVTLEAEDEEKISKKYTTKSTNKSTRKSNTKSTRKSILKSKAVRRGRCKKGSRAKRSKTKIKSKPKGSGSKNSSS